MSKLLWVWSHTFFISVDYVEERCSGGSRRVIRSMLCQPTSNLSEEINQRRQRLDVSMPETYFRGRGEAELCSEQEPMSWSHPCSVLSWRSSDISSLLTSCVRPLFCMFVLSFLPSHRKMKSEQNVGEGARKCFSVCSFFRRGRVGSWSNWIKDEQRKWLTKQVKRWGSLKEVYFSRRKPRPPVEKTLWNLSWWVPWSVIN